MNEESKERMRRLEESAGSAKEGGYYMEALQQYEDLLLMQKRFLPITAGQISKTCEEIVILCNILGMIYLKNESYQMSLDLLKKAEVLSKNNLRLKAITCNNLACYYSKTKKVRSAVNFLEEALTIEYRQLKGIDEAESFEAALLVDNPSDAHLNLCVSLSDLGKHEQALQNAMQALVFVQNEIIERMHLGKSQKEGDGKEEKKMEGENLLKPLRDRYAVLCIAYHNIAVQHEFLKNFDAALSNYKKAFDNASRFLGPSHTITKNMSEVYGTAREKIQEAKEKQVVRKSVPAGATQDVDSTVNLQRRTKKEELQALKAKLKSQYVKNVGGSPYHFEARKGKRMEAYERLMTPRTKARGHGKHD